LQRHHVLRERFEVARLLEHLVALAIELERFLLRVGPSPHGLSSACATVRPHANAISAAATLIEDDLT
jgi:hypothetical protein